jgi:hypothetical protein
VPVLQYDRSSAIICLVGYPTLRQCSRETIEIGAHGLLEYARKLSASRSDDPAPEGALPDEYWDLRRRRKAASVRRAYAAVRGLRTNSAGSSAAGAPAASRSSGGRRLLDDGCLIRMGGMKVMGAGPPFSGGQYIEMHQWSRTFELRTVPGSP